MKMGKLFIMVIAIIPALIWAPFAFGAVSPEEAAKLGTTLTGVGAEKAGNKDGTIPPFTGGLKKPPANYKPGSGRFPDPFAGEKPLFSINAQNMNQYIDKLTEGTKGIMQKYPTFRVDIYKTHRTNGTADFVINNTAKNAVKAMTYNDGLSLKGARAGVPFPIPKDGYEAMWNHLLRWEGRAIDGHWRAYIVDAKGYCIQVQDMDVILEYPYYDEDDKRFDSDWYFKCRFLYHGPARKAGEAVILFDPINMYEKQRIAYQYLPGQRRTKLAPEIGFDTPDGGTAGSSCYDDNFLFIGSMERYHFKLIGKKEMYVPYNCYRANWEAKRDELFGKQHMNPDLMRFELHRVWVVEATLRPGKRHVYAKRRFYIDEDSWTAVAAESYDAGGRLFRAGYAYNSPNYDEPMSNARFYSIYDLIGGVYSGIAWPAEEGGYLRTTKPRPERFFSPNVLASGGIR
jgi:hypothetical protein